MPRELKFHEQKMLKHSNLYAWDTDRNDENVMARYGIRKRSQLTQYRQTARKIRELSQLLSELPPNDEIRIQITHRLSLLLQELGFTINEKQGLTELSKFEASSLMNRRLPMVIVQQKMANNVEAAVNYIEHGHVSIGPQVVKDVNLHLKKGQEDWVKWTTGSVMERKVKEYNGQVDDFQ